MSQPRPPGRARGRARGQDGSRRAAAAPPRPGPPAPASQPSTGAPAPGYGAQPRSVPPSGALGQGAMRRTAPGRATSQGREKLEGARPPDSSRGGGGDVVSGMSVLSITSSSRGSKNGNGNGNGNGSGNGNGNGSSESPIGRGGMRGRRNVGGPTELTKTKPTTCATKQGQSGQRVNLQANYFLLKTVADWIIYQYRVDFKIEEDRTNVLKAWMREHKDALGGSYLFDGSMLFTSRRLTPGNEPLHLMSTKKEDNTPVQIEIRLVQELAYGNYVYLQIFNILMRRCLSHLKLHLVQRNYFDPQAKIDISEHHLELWPGYVTSIRQHERQILMCSEVSHKVMRTDTVADFLKECFTRGKTEWQKLFQQGIIGEIVLTDYNNKTYRVDDVDFSMTPDSTFEKSGQRVKYAEYYRTRYGLNISDLRQPLLVSRPSARDIRGGRTQHCLLVPELCRMTGLNNKMRENYQLMKAMAEHTRINPAGRIDRLRNFNRRLHSSAEVLEEFKQWQLSLDNELLTVSGRILPCETIITGGPTTFPAGKEADWTKNWRNKSMLANGKIEKFAIIYPRKFSREVESFLRDLKECCDQMRFILPRPDMMQVDTDRPADMLGAVEAILARYRPDMLMFICQSGGSSSDRYNAIKKKCCVDRGIPSQVMLSKNLTAKGVKSIATKIGIQINCKLGGAPWSVDLPLKNAMVVGYDACHDANVKSKTFGATVASLNQAMNIWFSSVSQHTSGEELSDHLSLDIMKALFRYKELNGKLPNPIFIYRDGVGEGQVNYVYHHEVEVVKKRLTEVYNGDNWRMVYIIVTKRINTRLFLNRDNPPPGTIVDDVITLPERFDFYLISQTVRQGTVSPTSYNIISDNAGLTTDQLQRWSYKMTHLYYNWSGTVRVPAPCQYAHKLAFLVSQSLHMEPHPNLTNRLFFL